MTHEVTLTNWLLKLLFIHIIHKHEKVQLAAF